MTSRPLTPFNARSLRSIEPLWDLHREVNRLFNDMFSLGGAGFASLQNSLLTAPHLDVRENEQELCVSAELPGVKSAELDVRLEGDTLVLSGEKRTESDQERENLHISERSFGRFQRSVQLPFTPDPDEVRADFENGVLNVHLKKHPEAQRSRRIEVRASGSGAARQDLKQPGRSGEADAEDGNQGSDSPAGSGARQGSPSEGDGNVRQH